MPDPDPNDGSSGNGTAPPPDDLPGMRARLAELTADRKALRAEIAPLREQAAKAEEYRLAAEASIAKLASREAEWNDERALFGAGLLDDEARDVARTLYARMPEADRPKSIGEWVSGLRAEGATVPRALQPYIGAPGTVPGAKPPPPPPQGGGKQPPAGAAVDGASLRSAREAWQKAGMPSAGPTHERLRALVDAARART